MENLNFNQSKQENIDSLRERAVSVSRKLVSKQKDFIEELKEILKNNETVRMASYEYGPIEESFADFRVIPWGHGNLDTRNLDFQSIIEANIEHKPIIDRLESIEQELDSRIGYIKETLTNFSGTQNEAFDLIQKIHKEYNLKPLNSDDTPILEKIS